MDDTEVAFAGVAGQARMVASGELSPRELVDLCLERIERLEPSLNAFRIVLAERARAEADAMPARPDDPARRPLRGVPIAVKDDQDVEGESTAYGTRVPPPPARGDQAAVRRLREAGAIVIGKTNVPELTIWGFTESAAWGITRNPWDARRSPGGSSGGSAAAVAAGLVPGATASDGLGSIRIPAAACGLFGLKSQRDRVPTAPKPRPWHGLAHLGGLTRSVADGALMLDVMAGMPPGRSFAQAAARPPGRLRIGISFAAAAPRVRVDPEVRDGVLVLGEALRALGHEVVECDPPYGVVSSAIGLARFLRGIHDDAVAYGLRSMERRTQAMARLGGLLPPRAVGAAVAENRRFAARLNRVFDEIDVVLSPVMAGRQLGVGELEGRGAAATFDRQSRWAPFCGIWNMTGQPACSVPAGWARDGLPLAAQLVTRENDEATLFSLAAQIEEARPWTDRRPPIS